MKRNSELFYNKPSLPLLIFNPNKFLSLCLQKCVTSVLFFYEKLQIHVHAHVLICIIISDIHISTVKLYIKIIFGDSVLHNS